MTNSNEERRGMALSAISFTAVLWGFSFLNTKVLLLEISPLWIAFLRFMIALGLLWIFLRRIEPSQHLQKSDWGRMALSGFLGTTLYYIFENTGLKYTTASNAVLIIAIIPAISVAIEHRIHRKPTTMATIVGVLISVVGVAVVVGPETVDLGSAKAWGNILMFGAALSWIGYGEVTRPLFERYSKLALTTYQYVFGTLFLLPLVLLDWRGLHPLSKIGWFHLLFLAILCSAVAYFLYLYAMDHLGTTVVTSFINLIPVVGVAGSVWFLHEELRAVQIIGGVVIVLGVWLVNWGEAQKNTVGISGTATV